ncbi:glycosyltransferase [Demequina sp. SO4-13]|uniref:glycosyltransferase n=1 Tax=Demequina sp. SO4-13 TaxID=3401027 RepID=UPI003AF499E3
MWPARQGGQVRMAGLIEALSGQFHTVVALPRGQVMTGAPVAVRSLGDPNSRRAMARGFLSPLPRIGHATLGAQGRDQIRSITEEFKPRAILYTHSYLAAMAGPTDVPVIVDFQNLETQRLSTFARRGRLHNRASAHFEYFKARRWEPETARRASLCLALSDADNAELKGWGAEVITVPNGTARASALVRSPRRGPAVYLASGDYAPNLDGGRWLLRHVWPQVIAKDPGARLVIAGRGTAAAYAYAASMPGVTVLGEVDDTRALLDSAAVVVAPVNSGGGQQLKVIEALSRARVVLATPFSARSVPPETRDLCITAEDAMAFSSALVDTLHDTAARWSREDTASKSAELLPTWRESVAPVAVWLAAR